jgi:TolB-like protein/DNA-binding winged helix-turn-helix (wHTH) protein
MATEPTTGSRIVRFGTFEADLTARELRKSGLRIKLQGQPFEILVMLLERPGELVTREDLQQRLWPTDTFVDFDHGVNAAINRLREALGDSADSPRFVETIPRRGYRFVAPVESHEAAPGPSAIPAPGPDPESHSPATEVPSPSYGRRRLAWVVTVVVLAALLAVLSLSRVRGLLFSPREPAHIQSVAVLPLVNLSGDKDQDYFADGMTEALTTDLGKIGALRVISRTSVMQYKDTKKTLPEIARELNVEALVEGTVARSGNHLRITANLVQASPEKHLWAETYETELGDILTVQGEVAQAVAREIQVKLTPEEQKLLGSARPVNPKAHDDYLKGRYSCGEETRPGLDGAVQYFQQAIEEDPKDPLAYAGLADCYAVWAWAGDYFAGDPSPKDVLPKAREAALKALELDDGLAEAHTALAVVELILDWNWPAAEREFKRAIELNPNHSPAHVWYAHYLAAMGRSDECIAESKRSLALDPVSEFMNDFGAWAFYFAHRYDLFLDVSEKYLRLNPKAPWPHYNTGLIYEHTGRGGEAIQEFLKGEERFGMSEDRLAELRRAYQQSGERGYWRKILAFSQEVSKRPRQFATTSGYGWLDYAQDADVAAVQVRIGDFNAAFASLEKGYANRGDALVYLNVDPYWDKIRSDPRFQDLVRRVGLPQ